METQILNMKRYIPCLLLLLSLIPASSAFAHGVEIAYTIDPTSGVITVQAAFDSGEVLSEAQVAIFAPSDLINPWMTGVTDADGAFSFTPDYTIEGVWDVQIRKAGHGGLIHLTLDASMIPSADSVVSAAPVSGDTPALGNGFTPLQVIIMSASVIWGFIGTALYFSRRKTGTT